MANYLSEEKTEYTRVFERFRGVDLSSEEELVKDGRFCYLVNMWRDYEAGQGDAVETFPGFRVLNVFDGRINGIFQYRTRDGEDFVVVHAGTHLHRFLHSERDAIGGASDKIKTYDGLRDVRSNAFVFADKLYVLDGECFYRLDDEGFIKVTDVAYVPTVYTDGMEYEQRNMMTDKVKEELTQYEGGSITQVHPYYFDDNEWETHLGEVTNQNGDGHCMVRLSVGEGSGIYRTYLTDLREIPASTTLETLILMSEGQAYGFVGTSMGYFSRFIIELDANNFPNLKTIYFPNCSRAFFENPEDENIYITGGLEAFEQKFEVHWAEDVDTSMYYQPADLGIGGGEYTPSSRNELTADCALVYSKAMAVTPHFYMGEKELTDIPYNTLFQKTEVWNKGEKVERWYATYVIFEGGQAGMKIELDIDCEPSAFGTSDKHLSFSAGNPEYGGTTMDAINRCTVTCHFDGRLFFTGNPELPNTVFYTQRDLTGFNNPTYIGVLNYMNNGIGNTPNTAMAAASGTLMVFKEDTAQDGSIYYYQGQDTGEDLIPRIYPSTAGVPGIGCLGAAVNFLDDVCFLSRRGLEAVGKQTVNLERTIEHRSSNVDKQLIAEQLSQACFAEWKGYLVILCGSHAYLADSRQIFKHRTGVNQYEWYYLDDLCTYAEVSAEYRGTEALPYITTADGEEVSLGEFTFADGIGLCAVGNGEDIGAEEQTRSGDIRCGETVLAVHYVLRDGVAYYVEETGGVRGTGKAAEACALASIGDVLYFGTADGSLCCINTDKRGQGCSLGGGEISAVEADQIHRLWYTHAGRRYLSGFATAMDDCDYPHLLKTTVKKSCVLKMKTMNGGGFRVQSRTDRTEWRQVQRSGGAIKQVITASSGGFDDIDFGATNYNGDGAITIPIMEKEKKWVEKQLYLYSDGYAQPFGIFGLAYRFTLAGRIKK